MNACSCSSWLTGRSSATGYPSSAFYGKLDPKHFAVAGRKIRKSCGRRHVTGGIIPQKGGHWHQKGKEGAGD